MKTSKLTGAALDWAVAKCEGIDHDTAVLNIKYGDDTGWFLAYSTDWAQGGPIIEREWLDITPWPNEADEELRWQCTQHDNINCTAFGPTFLIAAMRCYVASKLGEKIELPGELTC